MNLLRFLKEWLLKEGSLEKEILKSLKSDKNCDFANIWKENTLENLGKLDNLLILLLKILKKEDSFTLNTIPKENLMIVLKELVEDKNSLLKRAQEAQIEEIEKLGAERWVTEFNDELTHLRDSLMVILRATKLKNENRNYSKNDRNKILKAKKYLDNGNSVYFFRKEGNGFYPLQITKDGIFRVPFYHAIGITSKNEPLSELVDILSKGFKSQRNRPNSHGLFNFEYPNARVESLEKFSHRFLSRANPSDIPALKGDRYILEISKARRIFPIFGLLHPNLVELHITSARKEDIKAIVFIPYEVGETLIAQRTNLYKEKFGERVKVLVDPVDWKNYAKI